MPSDRDDLIEAGAQAIRERYAGKRVAHLADFAEEVAETVLAATSDEVVCGEVAELWDEAGGVL